MRRSCLSVFLSFFLRPFFENLAYKESKGVKRYGGSKKGLSGFKRSQEVSRGVERIQEESSGVKMSFEVVQRKLRDG